MKRDINLLECLNETDKKKSSSAGSLLVVIGVLAIIGVMVFMFVSAKMEIKDKEELIGKLDAELGKEGQIAVLEKKIAEDKARYQVMVQEIIKEVYSGKVELSSSEISSKFINVIYDEYARVKDAEGNPKVKIQNLNVNGESVMLSCQVRSWKDAWAFVRYLEGKADALLTPPAETATEAEIADYNAKKAKIEANARYFSGVLDNYPGLPVEGEGEEYDISLNLNFKVNWEEMAS